MTKNTEVSRIIEYIKLLRLKNSSSSFEITSREIGHALKNKNYRNISRAMLDDQLKPFEIVHIAPSDANYSSTTKIKYYCSTHWLVPANSSKYNFKKAFNVMPLVDWSNSNRKYKINDIVYIYSSLPDSCIKFRCIVTKIDIPFDESLEDSNFWIDKLSYENSKNSIFIRLKILDEFDNILFPLSKLKNIGLNGAPQGPIRINSTLSHFLVNSSLINVSFLDESDTSLYEGSQTKIFVNKYERNSEARKLCLENYGYTCQMCKLSMYETYGEYGKNFIHVHHRKPISEIGTEYKVNPIDDLIPLCPNCHEIIHRIQRAGYTPTQSETILKQILEQRKNI